MNAAAIADRVRGEGLLADSRPVVVLLSGGRDSTCLLDLAVRIAGAPAVEALHVNYGLRDQADVQFLTVQRRAVVRSSRGASGSG